MENSMDYKKELLRNSYKVKFKNAIMQVWTQVKKENQPKTHK